MGGPNLSNYLDQIGIRVADSERQFLEDIRALKGSQAARGMLNSGSTVALSLSRFEEKFGNLTDEIIQYLGKSEARTNISSADLLHVTASALNQSLLAFKSIVNRDQLQGFAPGKGVARTIDEVFDRVQYRLALRLQDYAFGIDDSAPQARRNQRIPGSDRYVALNDNDRAEIVRELAALAECARGANDVRDEDRTIALSELAAFEATIVQPRVASELVQRFVDAVLGWLQRTFTAATVQEVSQRLVQALLKLVS